MITIEELLDNMFTPAEYKLFDSFKDLDTNILNERGTVEQTKETKNGIVTVTTIFNSFDGETHLVKVNSYLEANSIYEAVKELNQQIANAVNSEDYLHAAFLKKQKDAMLQNSLTKTIDGSDIQNETMPEM